jgi:LacI family transcriptional regulator
MSSIKKLTDWLLDNKFSDLAFCFNSEIITSECEMLRGFLSALTERGIYFDQKNLIRLGNSYNTGGTEVDIIKASIIKERLQEYLDNGNLPEVIVCVNDATARMVVDAAKYLGIKIPEQLSVTGFEDNSGIANVLKDSVGLTTVHQDFSQFAKTIIDALLLLLQGKEITKPIMCDTHMVIRESVNLNLKKD